MIMPIESLEGLYHLPKLEEVSLRNNRILFYKNIQMFYKKPLFWCQSQCLVWLCFKDSLFFSFSLL